MTEDKNNKLDIIARRPRHCGGEYIVVRREDALHPYVSAVADAHSLSFGEWYWGHYFKTEEEALEHFRNR